MQPSVAKHYYRNFFFVCGVSCSGNPKLVTLSDYLSGQAE